MLRPAHALWLFGPTILLGGCPVYPSSCHSDEDCSFGYVCDDPSGRCIAAPEGPTGPERCKTSSDCEAGFICDAYDRCVPNGNGGESGGPAGSSGEAGTPASGGRG
jgi:hypothetical protein